MNSNWYVCYVCGNSGTSMCNCITKSIPFTYPYNPPIVPTFPAPNSGFGFMKCPVCEGRGRVPNGFYYEPSNNNLYEECRRCKGVGTI